MLTGKFCRPKYLVGAVLAIMALFAFNVGRPGIETNTAVAFNDWYSETSEKLNQAGAGQDSSIVMQVTIYLRDTTRRGTPTIWTIPTTSLADPAERESTARVLQLIRESGVFGLSPSKAALAGTAAISLSVRDASQQFDITLPYSVVENSIQLQNLITFLEVRATQQNTPRIEPTRL